MGMGHNPVIEVGHPLHRGQRLERSLDAGDEVPNGPGENHLGADVVGQLEGVALPASVLERDVLWALDATHLTRVAGNKVEAQVLRDAASARTVE